MSRESRPKFRGSQELRAGLLRFVIAHAQADDESHCYEVHTIFDKTYLGGAWSVPEKVLEELQEWIRTCYSVLSNDSSKNPIAESRATEGSC